MAKTAKLKKSSKALSTHSRASRRAASPSLNLDKSLTTLKPSSPPHKPTFLSAHHNAGITKPKSKKVLKRKQKIRIEQGKERAEAVRGKMERKVQRKGEKGVGLRGRGADWDELNERIRGGKGRKKKESGGDGWEDEDVDGNGNGEVKAMEGLEMEGPGIGGEDGGGNGEPEIL